MHKDNAGYPATLHHPPRPQAHRMNKPLVLESTVTCPACGQTTPETMPTDACQWFYECRHCHTLLKPKPGDCCVFCSYGSVPCPPVQQNKPCCG